MSLTQCADDMGLPKSSVSKAISKLETHMKAKLLDRTSRKIEITDAGQVVLGRAEHLLDEFRSLKVDVQELEQQVQGLIRIAAPPAMGTYMSEHILPPFLSQWPKAQVSLELSYDFDDLFAKGMDMAIRIGQVADNRLIAKEIGHSTRVLVASPKYLQTHGLPEHPQDLIGHNCVRFHFMPDTAPWVLVSGEQSVSVEVNSNLYCSNIDAIKRAAVSHLGIAQVPINNMIAELKSQELVRVLPEWHAVPMPIYLVYRPGAKKPKRVQTMIDYLMDVKKQFEFGADHDLCQNKTCPLTIDTRVSID